jgi:SAM-dependent methyltransferase
MTTDQTGLFVDFEGDNWYRRNRAALERFDPSADPAMQMIRQHVAAPRSVIEIGASNGGRVDAIVQATGARGVAVEPSPEAIADGRRRYPRVEFLQGAAHEVPVHGTFDLVIANFVLHWISRGLLLRSVSELDRLVSDGGYLLIGDFAPPAPARVAYHHLPDRDVFTYKQNYAELFASSGIYRLEGEILFGHGQGTGQHVGESDRCAVWLLRKSLHDYYGDAKRPAVQP